MRLRYLDLLRYGRFTDRRIELPPAVHDFHLIVGPNEAGKSTTRSAIGDLLYGIPARTSLAFLHAMPDLRLGAELEPNHPGEGSVLAIQRVKGNKQTLRDAADQPLPDNALAAWLGSADRGFFEQMFSLDHERMVKGGRGILSASDNLGQILFQSAAGIASLGAVRDDLQAQADRLWSARRSKDRAYYQAADELEAATAALKQSTVRTKDWTEAHGALRAADAAHEGLRQQLAEVRQLRARLERIRRVAPALASLAALAEQQQALGDAVLLPEDAASTLGQAERALGTEQVAIDHHAGHLANVQAQIDTAEQALGQDAALLAAAEEVTELDAQRLQYRAHAAEITRRQAECDALLATAQHRAAQLGWPADDEASLRARLPAEPVRLALARLTREAATVQQALYSAERTVRQKQAEIDATEAALAMLPAIARSAELEAALAQAQKLGDTQQLGRQLRQQAGRLADALERALAALGAWRASVGTLQATAYPSAATLQALGAETAEDVAQARALDERIAQLRQRVALAALDRQQFEAGHDTVSLQTVQQARQQRDEAWLAMRADPASLPAQGLHFEGLLGRADELADRRHATAQDASELQARTAEAERLALELEQALSQQADHRAHIAQRDAAWADKATACGLAGMRLDDAAAWLLARSHALEAAARLADAQAAATSHAQSVAEACKRLASACGPGTGSSQDTHHGTLDAESVAAAEAELDRLVREADRQAQAAANAAGRREALQHQQQEARRAQRQLQEDVQAACAAQARWQARWQAAAERAGQAADADPLQVEQQLAQLQELAEALAGIARIRSERIDKMQADLDRHAAAAQDLARRLAPDLAGLAAASIAQALAARLAAARQAQQAIQQLQAEAQQTRQQLEAATLRRDQARATLEPLMQQAATDSPEALRTAIAGSDMRRGLQRATAAAERTAAEGGDGLALAQLRTECTQEDPAQLPARLAELLTREDELVTALSTASAQRQSASAALHAIAGSADAAMAASRRQQALAAMADAVERFVQVHTAARLLRWSIERYREVKQGPMLAAASAVFAQLTLGAFERLVVDFEHDPPRLQGRRAGDGPSAGLVEIEGMSEGTQDQLFLALRLAALDMHLDHAPALPFIADDLFINYDDTRSVGGLRALAALSRKTQVLFLTHHEHLLPLVQEVMGEGVNVVRL